ncbi:DUF2680 domain-containing protein [Desulfosporosinus sp. FKA]|uniref:DUF2680 domain-containing protein n=1 Tax=Desulfosporosinus sp. FKA TaxID=1969834 RepID=UPI000B49EEEC|nr:DUF2680 domain-containing protein [Desulfosporosinus sp. FKA]
MKKKLAIGVLSVVLLVGGATAAFAATDSSKLDEIKSLTQQVFGIQKQIADKEVEAGIITQAQADAMKSSIDLRQQYSTQAIASGQVFGPGMGGMRGGMMYNNGQPMTDDQVKAWTDAMQAQIKVQEDALKKGTFVSGGMGMHGGMGGGRGMHGGFWGYNTVPSAGTSSGSNTQ